MARKATPDKWLFAATVGLALFGVVMVYSASAVLAQNEGHNQFFYVIKQGIFTLIGFAVMFAAMQFDYKRLKNRRVVYGLLIVTTLMLLAVFAFPKVNGAHRWIKLSRVFASAVGAVETNSCSVSRLFPRATRG